MEILHIQQGQLACTQGTPSFFFGEGGGCWIFLFPIVFPISSQNVPQVPNVFPNMFILLCPIWFALTSTLVTYISSPKEETTTIYIYLGAVWSLIKISVPGESKVPITKEKNCTGGFGGGSTQLIHMSHTLYHYKIQRRNGNNKQNRENWGWL
jgi:hypothetical protein